ncbi:MAG: serine hydrolase [Woeseiaceae bacterium]
MPVLNEAIQQRIRSMLERDEARAVVVGLYENGERSVIPFGEMSRSNSQPPDGDSLFEIGSVSKVFTALLAQSQVEAGRLSWDSTIGECIDDIDFASEEVSNIRLRELASHTSGLPRIPDNMQLEDPLDPYAGYEREDLFAFLAAFAPDSLVKQYDYSNLGAGLLGVVAADAAGLSFSEAMQRDVFQPMRLNDSWISVPDSARQRLAAGFSQGADMPNWSGFDALAGAGVIVSSVNDLLDFIEQNLGTSGFSDELAAIRVPQGDGETALGWHIREHGGARVYWHNGGTGGYASVLLMNMKEKTGVVLLTTSTAYDDVTAIGFAQLLGEESVTADLDLSAYPGSYQIAEGFLLSIFARDGRLFGQATGQGEFPLTPGAEHEFSNVAADIRIVFSGFDDGSAKLLTLFQSGRDTPAPRVAAEAPQVHRTVIDIDASRLEEYEGRYDLAPGVIITVESRDAQLFAQVTGQMAYPVFAYDTDRFFYKVVDAQLQFERDAHGEVIAVILHQAGQTRATRIN